MSVFRCTIYFGVLVVGLGYVCAITEEEVDVIQKDMIPMIEECVKELKISPEELKKARETNTLITCLTACVFDKFAIMDKGMMDVEGSTAILKSYATNDEDVENVAKLVESCAVEANNKEVKDGDKGCERSENFLKCLEENGKTLMA